MAGRARDIIVRFLGDDKDLQRATRSTETALGRLQKGFANLGGAIRAFIGIQLGRTLIDWAEAAAEEEKAQAILAQSLRTNVDATDAQIRANEEWIESMQLATLVADNDLRQAITNLTIAGRTLEEAQGDVAVAIDISKARGIELSTVLGAMARALGSGSTAGFARMGIATRDAEGAMLSYEEVLEEAAKTMGGTAATAANTLSGRLERLKIVWEEQKEDLGADVLPLLVEFGEILERTRDQFINAEDGSIRWRTALLGDLEALDTLMPGLMGAGGALADWAAKADDAAAATKDVGKAAAEAPPPGAAEAIANYGGILDDLKDQGFGAAAGIRDLATAQKELLDPAFAHAKAVERNQTANEDLDDAERGLADAISEHGASSDEAADAQDRLDDANLNVATSFVDVQVSAENLSNVIDSTLVKSLENTLRLAGLSEEAIHRLLNITLTGGGPLVDIRDPNLARQGPAVDTGDTSFERGTRPRAGQASTFNTVNNYNFTVDDGADAAYRELQRRLQQQRRDARGRVGGT